MIEGLFGGVLAIIAWELWRYYKCKSAVNNEQLTALAKASVPMVRANNEELTEEIEPANVTSVRRTTTELLLDTLKELQCDPTFDKEDNSISFQFQAENLVIRVGEGSAFAGLYDTFWCTIPATDIEALADIKRIVNDLNWQANATLSYTKDDKDNTFNVHTTYQLLCVDKPEFKDYLLNCFREFFHIQRAFYKRMDEAENKRHKE